MYTKRISGLEIFHFPVTHNGDFGKAVFFFLKMESNISFKISEKKEKRQRRFITLSQGQMLLYCTYSTTVWVYRDGIERTCTVLYSTRCGAIPYTRMGTVQLCVLCTMHPEPVNEVCTNDEKLLKICPIRNNEILI